MVWGSNVHNFAPILFTLFPFDGSLRIGCQCYQSVIPNRKDVDQLLENIFKYIDMLDENLESVATSTSN